jgi:hypothetical protein
MKRVINMKISETQYNHLKELSEHFGFTMTGYVQHLILNEYNKISQAGMLEKVQSLFNQVQNIEPNLLNQLGEKV